MERYSRNYEKLVKRWTDFVRRIAYAIIALSLLAAVGSVYYIVENIGINTDTTEMLSPDLPFRKNDKAVSRAFPQLSDNLIVVIEAPAPDLADDAALALGEEMRNRPKVFGSVYDLVGEKYFRQNGLLYLDQAALEELSEQLYQAQPFLTALKADPSLRGLFSMLVQALGFAEREGAAPIPLAPVLNAISEIAEKQIAGGYSRLSWQQLMEGKNEKGPFRRFLQLKPPVDFGSLAPADDAIEGVRALTKEMGFDGTKDVRVRLTGTAILDQEELESVEEGMGLAGILSLSLVLILLMVGLQSSRLVVANLVTLIVGLIWTAAFAVLAIGELNLISVAFAVLFIGLSVDFGIHYSLRYKEARAKEEEHGEALVEAAYGVAAPLTLSAIMAAIGFYSFLPTDYLGLAELGLIAGTGMFIALFANATILPALLTSMHRLPSLTERLFGEKRGYRTGWQVRLIHTNARSIVWIAFALALISLVLASQVKFDFDPMNLKDPNTESVSTILDLLNDENATPYSATVLAPNKEIAQALAQEFRELETVDSARSILDYLPQDQEEKLETIQDMALVLGGALAVMKRSEPTEKAKKAAHRNLVYSLGLIKGGKGELADAARRLLSALSSPHFVDAKGLNGLEERLLSSLNGRLQALETSLMAQLVTFDDLPKSLVSREVAADGRTKVEIYPKEDMKDRAALARFAEAVRSIAPEATGAPIVILEAGSTVLAAFRDAAFYTILAITVILIFLLRSFWNVVLVFAPLLLAALLTLAASVLFNLPFNFANLIVLPLLFALGVAGGIHLVMRERAEQAGGRDSKALETSTPRAVVFSALTTIGSFGSIALSSHPGTASMGILLTIAITLTMACTLLVLPALMSLRGVVTSRKG